MLYAVINREQKLIFTNESRCMHGEIGKNFRIYVYGIYGQCGACECVSV